MASALPHPQMRLNAADHHSSLKLSQQAPAFLQSHPSALPSFPYTLFSKTETGELWANYEQLLLTCLRTGDNESANECLKRITARFGPTNERVMGLRGLYDEATAKDKPALEKILKGYEEVLDENEANVVSVPVMYLGVSTDFVG